MAMRTSCLATEDIHPDFINAGEFYDLMPKHIVMNPIMTAMRKVDAERTDKFARGWLKWTT